MLRTLFFSMQSAQKGARRPKGFDRFEVRKLGVLGAGLMGAGVAYAAANAKLDVVLLDRDQAAADKGKQYSETRLQKQLARGRMTEEKVAEVLGRIHPTTRYEDLAGCDVVVEAVFEDRGVKATVTKQAYAQLGPDAIFGTNTSGLPISELAEASPRPESFIGMHFFSPVERMQLVEVIRGKQTSDETLAKTYDFLRKIKKVPIVVNDARNFYTSRVFGTYITQGFSMLLEGVKPALIENAGKTSGMPMPPLSLADEVGLDLMVHAGDQLRKDLGDEYDPGVNAPILDALVRERGRHGRKNGKGFYAYDDGGKRLWSGLGELFPVRDTQPDPAEVERRYVFAQCVETARAIEDGVIESVEDCDVGAILGWGFAPFTGGPCSYMDTFGIAAFVAEADRLADKYGKGYFEPPKLLRTMAAEGKTFY